jgi:hypothetical protein
VHDRAPGTAHRFESAADERLARLREDLDRHVVGNELLIDGLADEIELDLRRRRKADLDFLEADAREGVEHAQLARDVHGLDQGLVSIPQVHAAPDRRPRDHGVGPAAICEAHWGERTVFGARILQHGSDPRRWAFSAASNANGPLQVQTGR